MPLATVAAFNFGIFNRVIALGVQAPATEGDIDALKVFYSTRSQSRFKVEVTPVSKPQSLVDSLTRHGLAETGEREAKCWRNVENIPAQLPGVEVRELSALDREQWAAVNTAAWEMPSLFGTWFGATLGRDGFRHCGVFDGDLLVSTGAIFSSGKIAWCGFEATLPSHRGRGYQVATLIRLLGEAASMGCSLVHTETGAGTPEPLGPSLRNQLKVGFNRIYDKRYYVPSAPTVLRT